MKYKFKRHEKLVMEFDLSEVHDLALACLCFAPVPRMFPSENARNALYTFRHDYELLKLPSNVAEFPSYIACSACNNPIEISKGEHTVYDGQYFHNDCLEPRVP